ncbi:hypothetical protein ACLM5J_18475 [Nocardioides sp. Bht2]|uniref:hypothetical protein n=1 Tax=Nocardioides sp. Bht2 TaxID=3392297 RepID=UPI0039B6ADDB
MHQSTSATPGMPGSTLLVAFGSVGALLVASATVGGAVFGAYWDDARLTLLDPVLADDLGYIDATRPRGHCLDRPHGITPDQTSLMFFVGFVGTALLLAGYLSLAHRLAVLGAGWLGSALVAGPAAVGFSWHATGWLTPEHRSDWNPAELVLYHGDVGVTALLGGVFVLSSLAWLRARRRGLPHSDDGPTASLQP